MKHGGHFSFLSATRGLLLLLMFALPLFFLPVTLEPLEINKQTLLLVLTCAAALCWLGAQLAEKSITIRRGWTNVLPWLFVLAFLLPSMQSVAPYLSWVGAHRQEYTSVLTVLAVAVLFYLLANTMGQRRQHQAVHLTLMVGASLTAFLALLQTLGVGVLDLLQIEGLNTIGTLTGFITFLVVVHSFFLATLLSHTKNDSLLHDGSLGAIETILTLFLSLASLFFLLVLGDPILWFLFAMSMSIPFVFVFFRAKDFVNRSRLVWPALLLVASLLFWLGPSIVLPIEVPFEVTLNTQSSQMIAERTLQEHSSAWGSGPGTYLFDYSQFHDASLNETDFWSTRFDRASSFFLTLVPTIGVFGVTILGVFVVLLGIRAVAQVLRPSSRDEWLESFAHLVPWLTLVLSAFLVPWNLTLMASFGIFSGLLASQVMREEWKKSFTKTQGAKLIISIVFVVLSLAFFVGIFVTAQRYTAEIAFAKAVELDREGGDLQEIVTLLDRASTLNSYHDTYYRNLGEALLLRVDEELAGVSSLDTLTTESAQYIQSLTAAAVNASARATDLSPHNVLNWLSRGFVYRELIPVLSEASEFAVSSYQKAIELEPVSPANWTELGRTYLAVAERVRPLTASADADVAAQAQTQVEQMLIHAESAFERAVELKPNYAPAHFQLAVTYERQGRMDDAIGKMESVAQYNQLDVGVHFQLGMMYLQRGGNGDIQRAQVALEHTITLAPTYANAHWFLASVYETQGDITAAVREVEAVLELNPGNDLVQSRLQRLLTGQISTEVPEAIE